MNDPLGAVVLAAGKGTRMKSTKAKVLHEVFFRPMLHHVLDSVLALGCDRIAVVIGHQRQAVSEALAGYSGVVPVIQEEQLGTGHAVQCCEAALRDVATVLILCGDTPLVRPETLAAMLDAHRTGKPAITLLTTQLDDPRGYGRILSDESGGVLGIVEEKDADEAQRRIREINGGIYLVERALLFEALQQVDDDNSQGEIYLTDIVAIARDMGRAVRRFLHPDPVEVLGVNSRLELAQAHEELQRRRNEALMREGVTVYLPHTVCVAQGIPVGRDTVLHPGVRVTGRSRVGEACEIGPGAVLHDCRLEDGVVVGANCVLSNCQLERMEHVAPLTHRIA